MKLEVKDLVKTFGGRRVLDGVSAVFETGNIYGLFGRNGVGKSTFFRCIDDRIPFEEGSIEVDGVDARDGSGLVALANDDNMFPSDMLVRDIVRSFASLRDIDEEPVLRDLDSWGVDARRKWEKLSTGGRTMLMNALAINSACPFILLDEPVLGLDALNRDALYTRLLEDFGDDRCLVISSHIIDEVASFASHVMFLQNGHVTLSMPSDQIADRAHMLSGSQEALSKVSGNWRLVSKGSRLGVPYMCVIGDVESIGDDVRDERVDLQRLFIEMTREEEK